MLNFQCSGKCPRWVAFLTGLLFSPGLAYAQGCAMCYTSAAAAKAGAVQALRSGILILLVPALVMFAGIIFVIYRFRDRYHDAAGRAAGQDREWPEDLQGWDDSSPSYLTERTLPPVIRSARMEGRPPGRSGPLTADN